jgi:mttA/Hcf106 family
VSDVRLVSTGARSVAGVDNRPQQGEAAHRPRKLPELGKSLGRSISEFKKATNEFHSSVAEEIRLEEKRVVLPAAASSALLEKAVPAPKAG